MASEKQIKANRLNSKKSCGPRTSAGKERSKMNAVKAGIFSLSILIPGEDRKEHGRLVRSWIAQLQPKGPAEDQIVDEIAAVSWRLLRYSKIEAGLFQMYRVVDGKSGTLAQAFAHDQKNLATITKVPLLEDRLDRKLDRLLKRFAALQAKRQS